MPPKQSFIQRIIGESTVDNRPAHAEQQANLDRIRTGIANNETSVVRGDPYKSSQNSGVAAYGRALGKYRVTEAELNTYGKRFLGSSISPDDFLNSPSLQDQYINHKANYYLNQGYTPQQFADIHNKGLTNEAAPGASSYQSPNYVNKFNATYTAPVLTRSQ